MIFMQANSHMTLSAFTWILTSIEGKESITGPDWVNWIITFLPLTLLLFFFFYFARILKPIIAARKRTLEHMTRMEEKTDRLITILEAIRDGRSEPGRPPS
jgi:hypothetical protein